jgi:hypothetical protein
LICLLWLLRNIFRSAEEIHTTYKKRFARYFFVETVQSWFLKGRREHGGQILYEVIIFLPVILLSKTTTLKTKIKKHLVQDQKKEIEMLFKWLQTQTTTRGYKSTRHMLEAWAQFKVFDPFFYWSDFFCK